MSLFNLKKSDKLTVGARGENEAVSYFKNQGYRIIERNYRYSRYEIDFIAQNRDYIVFVEVKARSCTSPDNMPYGRPSAAVNKDKQRFLIYAAKAYLKQHKNATKKPRLDVVEIYFDNNQIVKNKKILKINHIPNAFGE